VDKVLEKPEGNFRLFSFQYGISAQNEASKFSEPTLLWLIKEDSGLHSISEYF
jgi:hypothetical protein